MLDNKTVYTYDKNEITESMPKLETEFGTITEGFRLLGFKIIKQDKKRPTLHLAGVIVRSKQNSNFSIDMDWAEGENTLYLVQYKL